MGLLGQSIHFRTGGRGSGGTVDPLASQGSLRLSEDKAWLLAANAGSGTLSVFRVEGSHLELSDQVPTEGSEPNSVAEHAGLVYVLNTAGTSSVVGFQLRGGRGSREFRARCVFSVRITAPSPDPWRSVPMDTFWPSLKSRRI